MYICRDRDTHTHTDFGVGGYSMLNLFPSLLLVGEVDIEQQQQNCKCYNRKTMSDLENLYR